jgi:hypothetical protein
LAGRFYKGDEYGQSDVSAGLGDVIAISAGDSQTIVLKNDGHLESWGYSKDLIPADLPPVTAQVKPPDARDRSVDALVRISSKEGVRAPIAT